MKPELCDLIDSAACAHYVDLFDKTIEDDKVAIWRDELSADVRIFNAETKVAGFKPLHEKMVAFYADQRGRPPHHSFLMVNRIKYIPGNLGSGGGWHRDTWFNQHKVFAFLTDVGPENGPFEYLPHSRGLGTKVGNMAKYGRTLRVSHDRVANEYSELLTVHAGQAAFFDTTVVHRGRPIEKGTRYAATLYAFEQTGRKLKKIVDRFSAM